MNDKPKRKLRWRLLRWGLIGLAVIATLAAILVTEENWRGKHVWETYKQTAEARGERFEWAAFAPTNVPDDQNFFRAPMVAGELKSELAENPDGGGQRGSNPASRKYFNIYRGDSKLWPTNGGNWQKGKLTDLGQWQNYFRKFAATPAGQTNGFPVSAQPQSPATDVLLALSAFNPALEELRQASLRPVARLPLNYDNGFEDVGTLMPGLATEKRWAQFLQLRSLADLQADQGAAALEDVKLLLRLTDTLRSQPFLISHLVRIAMQAIALQPIYEGLAQHRWNDAQLVDLEAALGEKDYLADFQFSMRGELTCAISAIEIMRRTREMTSYSGEGDASQMVTNSLRWSPSAFFYQNELAFCQMYEQFVLPLVDLTNRTVSIAACRTAEAAYKEQAKHWSFYKILARMTFPAYSKAVNKFVLIQSQVDLARVACALERFRLAHGNYPDTLDALTPSFIAPLPHDVINGQPLHYRRTDDGQFVLYSVGWDEKDDGGQIFLTKGGSVDQKKGDWVWQYPLK
jgi:hypothetical protein